MGWESNRQQNNCYCILDCEECYGKIAGQVDGRFQEYVCVIGREDSNLSKAIREDLPPVRVMFFF